jgi:hypothetical protein
MQNRLHVGNLAGEPDTSSLQELFELFGFVMDVKWAARDEASRQGSSALVAMATDESATVALNGADLHGAIIAVEVASAVTDRRYRWGDYDLAGAASEDVAGGRTGTGRGA